MNLSLPRSRRRIRTHRPSPFQDGVWRFWGFSRYQCQELWPIRDDFIAFGHCGLCCITKHTWQLSRYITHSGLNVVGQSCQGSGALPREAVGNLQTLRAGPSRRLRDSSIRNGIVCLSSASQSMGQRIYGSNLNSVQDAALF